MSEKNVTISKDEYKRLKDIENDFKSLNFPSMLRKMWSGGEVCIWLEKEKNRIFKKQV